MRQVAKIARDSFQTFFIQLPSSHAFFFFTLSSVFRSSWSNSHQLNHSTIGTRPQKPSNNLILPHMNNMTFPLVEAPRGPSRTLPVIINDFLCA